MAASVIDNIKALFQGCQKDPDLKQAQEHISRLEKVLEERKWHLQLQRH